MIEVVLQDITRLDVDAIVNAANSTLLGGGGVDGAIHRAAGKQLVEYCRALGGCSTGEACITPGFNLPAKWVIHTVGPVWQGGDANEALLLERCYRNCFEIARQNQIKSIAFPSISTGVYGYPKERAVVTAVSVMRQYESLFDRIIACCFSAADVSLYEAALA
jgi:O-acetyl-ADP-ribose deacetylase (regulator of RNase III)